MIFHNKYFFSFGDYEGGTLRFYSADEMYYLDLDTRNTPHAIDARLYHEVILKDI